MKGRRASRPGASAAVVSLRSRIGPVLLLDDTSAAEAPDRLASLPFLEHDLVTFDYIELDDNSPA